MKTINYIISIIWYMILFIIAPILFLIGNRFTMPKNSKDVFKLLYTLYSYPYGILHEMSHILMCLILNIKIDQVLYEVIDNEIGLGVIYDTNTSSVNILLINIIAPIIMSILTISVIILTGQYWLFLFLITRDLIPSTGDINVYKQHKSAVIA